MKNQLDLIISGTIFVIALIVAGAFFATKRQVTKPAAPTPPTLTAVKAPNPMPEMTNGLALAGGTSGGGGRGAAGGPPSFGQGGPGVPSFGQGGPGVPNFGGGGGGGGRRGGKGG